MWLLDANIDEHLVSVFLEFGIHLRYGQESRMEGSRTVISLRSRWKAFPQFAVVVVNLRNSAGSSTARASWQRGLLLFNRFPAVL